MERFLGVDVHGESCTSGVLSESGREVERQVVETNGQALVGYLRQLPGTLHLCLEEGEWTSGSTKSCRRTWRRTRVAEMLMVATASLFSVPENVARTADA